MCVVIKQKEHIFVYVNVCMCIHICTYLHKHTHPSDYCQQKRYIEKYEIGENKVGRDQRTYSTYLPEEKQASLRLFYNYCFFITVAGVMGKIRALLKFYENT